MRRLDTLERINKKTEQTRMLFGPTEYTVAEYLTTVTDPNLRKTLTMYRLSEHSLAIENGRRRQNEMETELHILTHISLRLNRTKNLKTNPILINSHIYWVKYHSVPSRQQDL